MNRIHALTLALLLTLLIANTLFLFSTSNEDSNLREVIVGRVIDGDTFETDIGEVIRLANINSPEKSDNLPHYAFEYLSEFTNKTLMIDKIKVERYGRTLARIYDSRNNYINLEIVKKGFSSKFLVDESELKEFNKAENSAVDNAEGIWDISEFNRCLSGEIDEREEKVLILNSCTPIDMSGWMLKDESRKQYKFKIILNNGITLHSGTGNDSSTDIFWNSKENIWNNDRDTLYLFDKDKKIALHKSYGY